MAIAFLCTLISCTTVDRGKCLDWDYYTIVEENCTPLYGNMICLGEEVTHYYCVLWEEQEAESQSRN